MALSVDYLSVEKDSTEVDPDLNAEGKHLSLSHYR